MFCHFLIAMEEFGLEIIKSLKLKKINQNYHLLKLGLDSHWILFVFLMDLLEEKHYLKIHITYLQMWYEIIIKRLDVMKIWKNQVNTQAELLNPKNMN